MANQQKKSARSRRRASRLTEKQVLSALGDEIFSLAGEEIRDRDAWFVIGFSVFLALSIIFVEMRKIDDLYEISFNEVKNYSAGAALLSENVAAEDEIAVETRREFLFNDEVQTADDVFIFESPEAGSRIAGEKSQSSQGRIIGGPRNADGYVWWFVDYDEDPDGWTAENWLK